MQRAAFGWLTATALGWGIGALDFLATDFCPAVVLSAFGGCILGWLFPTQRGRLAVWLGVCVPIAIIAGMALHQHPARGHFVFIDARAVLIALLGAAIGGWLHGKASPSKPNLEEAG